MKTPSTDPDRLMLSFRADARRFNYRVAAVIVRDDHVLICREEEDDYTLLPGGRVEHGERSDESLAREIVEELKTEGKVGRLLFTVENFFERHGQVFHELAKYYAVELPDDFPFVSNKVALTTQDEGHDLHFAWVPIGEAPLAEWNLLPSWLRNRFAILPDEPQHLIIDER